MGRKRVPQARSSPFLRTFQLEEAASHVGQPALVPVENRLQPRGLDLAPFQTQNATIEHQQLVLRSSRTALSMRRRQSRRAASRTASMPAPDPYREHIEQRAALIRLQPACVTGPSAEDTI
jgi:hypothetical protein